MNKLEHPTIAPHRCVFCTGHRGGPVIDTLIDYPFGRLYVCLSHAQQISATAGFAEGEEMEKLKNAAVSLGESEKGIAREQEAKAALASTVKELTLGVERLTEERDHAQLRLAQTEAKLAELGQGIGATLAAVGSEPFDYSQPVPHTKRDA